MADRLDWTTFFVATTLLAIPGLLLLARLWRHEAATRPEAGGSLLG